LIDRRRFLLTSLAGAVAAPLGAWAQVTGKIPRVGVLAGGDGPVQRAFYGRLAELGYREGHPVEILRYFHGGVPARAAAAAGELVPLKPDVIGAVSPPSAFAVNKLTTTIPIVFYGVGQPVEVGLSSRTWPGRARTSRGSHSMSPPSSMPSNCSSCEICSKRARPSDWQCFETLSAGPTCTFRRRSEPPTRWG